MLLGSPRSARTARQAAPCIRYAGGGSAQLAAGPLTEESSGRSHPASSARMAALSSLAPTQRANAISKTMTKPARARISYTSDIPGFIGGNWEHHDLSEGWTTSSSVGDGSSGPQEPARRPEGAPRQQSPAAPISSTGFSMKSGRTSAPTAAHLPARAWVPPARLKSVRVTGLRWLLGS